MAWRVGLVDFSGKSEVQSDGRCVSTYMNKYLVRTDSPVFLEIPVVAASIGIVRGSPFGADPNAICQSAEITPISVMTKPPFLAYYATYIFSTAATLPQDNDDDPTTTRTLWSVSPQIQSRYVIRDRNGKLIVNTAGSPFDGGIPVDVRLGSVTATRRVDAAGYNMSGVLANSGKLNSATYLGGAPGTVQVDISAAEKYEGAYHFWDETYTFSYDPAGWQPKPISAGFFQKVDGVLQRITNGDVGDTTDEHKDEPVQEPEPLVQSGAIAPPSGRPNNCVFVTVDYFDDTSLDFNDFNL